MAADGEESKPSMGWKEKIEDQWRKTKEHAEAYPYVWASYIVVYGGIAVYMTYKWRKLRKTEDRVRVLHERLKKLVDADNPGATSSSTAISEKSADKASSSK